MKCFVLQLALVVQSFMKKEPEQLPELPEEICDCSQAWEISFQGAASSGIEGFTYLDGNVMMSRMK